MNRASQQVLQRRGRQRVACFGNYEPEEEAASKFKYREHVEVCPFCLIMEDMDHAEECIAFMSRAAAAAAEDGLRM